MALKGSFEGIEFKRVEGYRIAVCLTPGQGFSGHFLVYVWDRMEAGTPFEKAAELGEEGQSKRGTLELASDDRTYKFEKIDLRYIEAGATRRERFRLLEFRYDKELTDRQKPPVDLSNQSKVELKKSALGEDYTYSISGSKKHLLGFRSRISANEANVLRFTALRNKTDSFLEKVIQVAGDIAQQKAWPEFTVRFSQGDIEVKGENLLHMYVDESYGEMRRVPQPGLTDLISASLSPELSRVSLADFTAQDLLEHDASPQFTEVFLDPQSVETATLVFRPGFYRELKIK